MIDFPFDSRFNKTAKMIWLIIILLCTVGLIFAKYLDRQTANSISALEEKAERLNRLIAFSNGDLSAFDEWAIEQAYLTCLDHEKETNTPYFDFEACQKESYRFYISYAKSNFHKIISEEGYANIAEVKQELKAIMKELEEQKKIR
jgi:hypothetical protein